MFLTIPESGLEIVDTPGARYCACYVFRIRVNILVTISELVKQSRRQDTDLGRGAKRTRESKDRRGARRSPVTGQEAIGDRRQCGRRAAVLSGNAPVSLLNYDKRLREKRREA